MGNSQGRQSDSSSPRHRALSLSSSSSPPSPNKQKITFDGGFLIPHGVYKSPPDYNAIHVVKFIRDRKLAPFYKPLDDYDDSWTDYQLACFVRDGKLPATAEPFDSSTSSNLAIGSIGSSKPGLSVTPPQPPLSNASTPSLLLSPKVDSQSHLLPSSQRSRGMSFQDPGFSTDSHPSSSALPDLKSSRLRPRALTTGSSTSVPTRESSKPLETVLYRGALECPVCMLYYPVNINRTRCCWKPICTECFVELKRSDPHYPHESPDAPPLPPGQPSQQPENLNPMNLISEPVRCPFCVKSDFGVVYSPPDWLPSLNENRGRPEMVTSPLASPSHLPLTKREEMYSPHSSRVVLSDAIRPDWQQILAHKRRTEARRLATATALQQALAVAGQRRVRRPILEEGNSPPMRRMGRRVDGMIRITRDEADEMMLQEAIRQSLLSEEEERKKRDDEERKKANDSGSGKTAGESSSIFSVATFQQKQEQSPATEGAMEIPIEAGRSNETFVTSPRSFLNALSLRPQRSSGDLPTNTQSRGRRVSSSSTSAPSSTPEDNLLHSQGESNPSYTFASLSVPNSTAPGEDVKGDRLGRNSPNPSAVTVQNSSSLPIPVSMSKTKVGELSYARSVENGHEIAIQQPGGEHQDRRPLTKENQHEGTKQERKVGESRTEKRVQEVMTGKGDVEEREVIESA